MRPIWPFVSVAARRYGDLEENAVEKMQGHNKTANNEESSIAGKKTLKQLHYLAIAIPQRNITIEIRYFLRSSRTVVIKRTIRA